MGLLNVGLSCRTGTYSVTGGVPHYRKHAVHAVTRNTTVTGRTDGPTVTTCVANPTTDGMPFITLGGTPESTITADPTTASTTRFPKPMETAQQVRLRPGKDR